MIKFRKSKIVVAVGLILAGTMGTVVLAGGNSNGENLLSRCRSTLCVESEICRDGSQCVSNGVCNESGSCVENETCVNKGQCVTDGTCRTGNQPGTNGTDTDAAINKTGDSNTVNQTEGTGSAASVSGKALQYSDEACQNEAGICDSDRHGTCDNRENNGYHHGNPQNHGNHHGRHH